jgi:tRNA threonylcarbamoyl adenosine modification protein (Sua5/YciO/YrdC/YwlC family)
MALRIDVHPKNPQTRAINQAAERLRAGDLCVYPTDSGYAFGFALGNKAAQARVEKIRKLDKHHNFTLAVRDLKQVTEYAKMEDHAFRLMKSHTPGPYTFILPASANLPKRLQNEKRRSVGVRIIDSPTTAALLEALNEPLLTSTLLLPDQDLHGLEVDDLFDVVDEMIDFFLDVGPCGDQPTTVVELLGDSAKVLREGAGRVDWV